MKKIVDKILFYRLGWNNSSSSLPIRIKNGNDSVPIKDNCLEEESSDGSKYCLRLVQFETRKFGHHCQYTVKKCKIGFTLLTSILPFATILIDMRLT
jgi:hypothetical protein